MKIGVVSDTHGKMHPAVLALFAGVDAIFHAGDIGNEDIITALETIAPTYAVHGNVDGFPLVSRYPAWRLENIGGLAFFTTHIFMPFTLDNLRKLLSGTQVRTTPEVFIYGHTHQARIERLGRALTINPGSAGPRRFRATPSIAFLEVSPDRTMHAWVHQLR